jgi:lipoprotein NlpD
MTSPRSTAVAAPRRLHRALACVSIVVVLGACASRQSAPVEDRSAMAPPPIAVASSAPPPALVTAPAPEPDWRPQSYTVKRGDTLHQIALDHGLDYRELAALNALENPNLIRAGQVLRLTAPAEAGSGPAGVTTAPLRPAGVLTESRPPGVPAPVAVRAGEGVKSSPKALKEPYSPQAVRELTLASTAPSPITAPPAEAPAASVAPRDEAKSDASGEASRGGPDGVDDDRLDWGWPVKGKIVGTYAETANLKGIDIAGKAGDPVLASAPGKVVYAGSGLRGYGKLIIIKHNRTYLSAYAHNREILVREGQQVGKGQKIAEMGNTDAEQVKLHFEIRRHGKPMDPVRYLPPA